MKEYRFKISCDKQNPVPYKRTTTGGKWDKNYKRYLQWKSKVQLAFHIQHPTQYPKNHLINKLARPFMAKGPYEVRVICYNYDRRHGDTDNVAKGINDALFKTDKFVFGTYFLRYDAVNPRVEVIVMEYSSFEELEEQWQRGDLSARYAL